MAGGVVPASPRSNEPLAQIPLARGGSTVAVPEASALEVTPRALGFSEFIGRVFMAW